MTYLEGEKEKEAIQWMNAAADVARKALCHKAKCGTVIVRNEEIIGEGYNAPPLDSEENRMCDAPRAAGKPKYDQTCCMHAEWRAILDAMKRNPEKIKGAKLYFSRVGVDGEVKKAGEPFCTVCSRMTLDAGISHFVLWHEEGIREYPADEYDRLSYGYVHKEHP